MSCYGCIFKGEYQDMGVCCDACKLQDYLPDAINACDNSENCPHRVTLEEAKKKLLSSDVVEVVRCKDCKHNPRNGGECDRSITHTSRDYVCEVNTYKYIGIDYCSYGERREGGNENK